MRGLAAQTAAAHHIHVELRRPAILAWCAFLAVFFAISYFHVYILFFHTKNKLWSATINLFEKKNGPAEIRTPDPRHVKAIS